MLCLRSVGSRLPRSFAHCYPPLPWVREPETRLGLSAFSPLHFVLSLISPACPHLTATLARVFHPRPSFLAPRGPHLPACRSAPHELLWAGPAYFPSWGAAGSAQAQSGLECASSAPWRSLSPLFFGRRRVPSANELLHFSSL